MHLLNFVSWGRESRMEVTSSPAPKCLSQNSQPIHGLCKALCEIVVEHMCLAFSHKRRPVVVLLSPSQRYDHSRWPSSNRIWTYFEVHLLLMEEILHQLIWKIIPLFTKFCTSQVVQDVFHQTQASTQHLGIPGAHGTKIPGCPSPVRQHCQGFVLREGRIGGAGHEWHLNLPKKLKGCNMNGQKWKNKNTHI